MIPLVGFKQELDLQVEIVHRVAKEVMAEKKVKLDYMVGTMIEMPRGALTADEIAQTAEFFSFGTNDLTQTALGMSRDDSGSFLPPYARTGHRARRIRSQSIDQTGVGQLMKIAVEKGRRPGRTSSWASAASTAATRTASSSATDRAELRELLAVPRAGGPPGRRAGGAGRGGRQGRRRRRRRSNRFFVGAALRERLTEFMRAAPGDWSGPSCHCVREQARCPCAQVSGTSTAAPRIWPARRRSRARWLAERERLHVVRTGMRGASARNSSPSRRVRLATERSCAPPRAARRGRRGCRSCGCRRRRPCRPCARRAAPRDELAGRREDDRRVELLGRRLVGAAGPRGAELDARTACACAVARRA